MSNKEIKKVPQEVTPEDMYSKGHKPMVLGDGNVSDAIRELPGDDPIKQCFSNNIPKIFDVTKHSYIPRVEERKNYVSDGINRIKSGGTVTIHGEQKMLPGVPPKNKEEAYDLILKLMNDIEKHSNDVIWVGETETIFDRLRVIFMEVGGNYETLRKEFPYYYE